VGLVLRNVNSPPPPIYEQVSSRIVATNAPSLPIPEFRRLLNNQWGELEDSSAMDFPIQFYEQLAHLPFILRAPFRKRTVPYPQRQSDLVPYLTVPENVHFAVSENYRDKTVGPESELSLCYRKDMEYLKKLEVLGAIAVSGRKEQLNIMDLYRGQQPTLGPFNLKYEEWRIEINRLERKRYAAKAIVRLATHMALDTIAYCSGLEAPTFPADETLMGTMFFPPLIPGARNPQTPEDDERISAVLIERLGAPCWGITRKVQPQRLDFVIRGKPDADPVKELEFQGGMRQIAQRRKPLCVPVYAQERRCPRASAPSSGVVFEVTDELRAIILHALDSEMPDAYTIEETSARLKGLLGAQVWSGVRYEDGCHFETIERAWYQTRDILMHMGSHAALPRAHLQIPPGYFNPKLRLPIRTGEQPKVLARIDSANRPTVLPAIPQGRWYRLTASPYPMDTGARGLSEEYRARGVLAFKSNVVVMKERGVRQKDSPKAVEISFLFKQMQHRDTVLQALRDMRPNIDARAVDDDAEGLRTDYHHFSDEGYVRQLFADSRPVGEVSALLELAPPSNRPVNVRENASTMAINIERARQALLADMFETSRYPPLLRSSNDPPVLPRKLGHFWCTSEFLHRLTQAPGPANFSETDVMQFKRLSLFLLLLAEFSHPAFRIPVYASQNSPYVRLIRHIVGCIERAYASNSTQCGQGAQTEPGRIFHQGAQDESIGAEYVQYAPKDRRFVIVLDRDRRSPEYVPSRTALEEEKNRVEAVIARAAERSKNKGKQKDA